jgi:nicotinate dehydrogenase subunit A
MKHALNVNGSEHSVEADPGTPLLYILRNDLQLKGVRAGCAAGHCGACTVLVDARAVQSCDLPLSAAVGHKITTIEGLGTTEKPHPLQSAFVSEQAAQCGYCINGILMSAAALLARNAAPSKAEIAAALERHLCRCGSHTRILRAVARAAAK